jgi:SAM-dependent methyltransferase
MAGPNGYSFYWTEEERVKSVRRTVEWTVNQLEKFGCFPPARVLSVGCGNGVDVLTLRERGYTSFGSDICFSGYPGKYFAIASGAALPFGSEQFDSVVALEVIEHVDADGKGHRRHFAEELQRVTRRGGFVLIATPNKRFPIDEHGDPLRVHSPWESMTLSFRELCKLFSQCRPHALTPSRYFAFRRFVPFLGTRSPAILDKALDFLGSTRLHSTPLNPHLFVAFVKTNGGGD